jgi:heat shock protein HtpX
MKRKAYGRDAGLTLRMFLTTGLLGLVYVTFAVLLFSFLNIGLVPLVLIVAGLAFFQYFTSDKLALLASGAKVVERDQAPDLHAMVERLCAMAELPKPRVAIIDSDVPNAFATGRSPKHAAVAVTTGLMRRLNQQEIEGVLAHELSHVKNRDVRTMTFASFFAMLAAMIARFALPRVCRRPRLGDHHRRTRAPDERAAEDRVADVVDPAARSARGAGHERVLHRPD